MSTLTPYGHPLRVTHRAPDPHHVAAEAETAALNAAWLDGTPEYRAEITASLRRADCDRFTCELQRWQAIEARAPCDEHRRQIASYVELLAEAEADEAVQLAILGAAAMRRAA